MRIEELFLNSLEKGTPGITGPFGACLADAAAVCLEEQGHCAGTKLLVEGSFKKSFHLWWNQTTEQIRRCWADRDVTTEHGACGVAILLAARFTRYTVLERSYRGTGFDYWLGTDDTPDTLFQRKVRLEVSGIRRGQSVLIDRRAKQKLQQVKRYESPLPTLVIVVEFSEPRSRVTYNGKHQ